MTAFRFTRAMICALSFAMTSPPARAQVSDALDGIVLVQRIGSAEKPRMGIVVSDAGHVVFVRRPRDDPYESVFVARAAALPLAADFDWSALPRVEIVSISDHPDLILVRVLNLAAKPLSIAAGQVEPGAPLYSSRIESADAPFIVFDHH